MIDMTFDQAKKRDDYTFTFGGLDSEKITPEMFREAMIKNDVTDLLGKGWGYLDDTGDGICMAVLEIGHLDAELFLYCFEDHEPWLDIFINVETSHGWQGADSTEQHVVVSWESFDWVDDLALEMFLQLRSFAERHDLSFDEYND